MYDKGAIDAAVQAAQEASEVAIAQQDPNQGIALEQKEKKTMKQAMSNIGEAIKQDPTIIGDAAGSLSEPLVEHQKRQRARQEVPGAEELAGPPVDLYEAFDI